MLHTLVDLGVIALGIGTGFHALLEKRDPRSALVWIVLCVLAPVAGAVLYWVVGVDRIKTRSRLRKHTRFSVIERTYGSARAPLDALHPERAETMSALVRISERVTRRPLLHGNRVAPLHNGEEAYPPMLEAIRSAERSVYLCTYLFDTDEVGNEFIDALGAAAARGVDVRVLIDAVGDRGSRPRASRVLRRRQAVKVARYLPLSLSLRSLHVNLRNHRKLLIADSRVAFTGGMNISRRHRVSAPGNKRRTADLHFEVTGPVVLALEDTFLEDWAFATGDDIRVDDSEDSAPFITTGAAVCRVINDGPNEDFEALTWILAGALGAARSRVQIMTPYFIPSRELVSAFNAASLRGVTVDIILPERSNLPFIDWATRDLLDDILRHGVNVYYEPPPFNHTKLFIVDCFYVNLGSANLDPRSLRLDFELNLEVYDAALARTLSDHFDATRARSRQVRLTELAGRPLVTRTRDALARLLAPYL